MPLIPYAGQEFHTRQIHWRPQPKTIRRAEMIAAICDRNNARRSLFLEIKLMRARRRISALNDPPRPGTARWIIRQIADKHYVSVADINSEGRTRPLCRARWEVWYELATKTTMSLSHIGKVTGGKDHTSVRNGILRHAELTGLPPVRGIVRKPSKSTTAD
jgi:chromosomal replication initiation ATPase DnaA